MSYLIHHPPSLTDDGCAGSVVSTTFGGVTRYPSFSNFGSGKLVFKITQMAGYNATNVNGLEVGFCIGLPLRPTELQSVTSLIPYLCNLSICPPFLHRCASSSRPPAPPSPAFALEACARPLSSISRTTAAPPAPYLHPSERVPPRTRRLQAGQPDQPPSPRWDNSQLSCLA